MLGGGGGQYLLLIFRFFIDWLSRPMVGRVLNQTRSLYCAQHAKFSHIFRSIHAEGHECGPRIFFSSIKTFVCGLRRISAHQKESPLQYFGLP